MAESGRKSPSAETCAARLRLALDMFATGEAIMRQNLRRKYPEADSTEIERRLVEWIGDRPGAPHGDASGRAMTLVSEP